MSKLKFKEREYCNPFRQESRRIPHTVDYESDDDKDETFNDHMEKESYFKPPIDDFLQSGPTTKLVIVLVNFSVIGVAEKKRQLLPAEMALTAFSLESGIVDNCVMYTYHGGQSTVLKNRQVLETLEKLDLPARPPHVQWNNFSDIVRVLQLFRKKHEYRSCDSSSRPALLFCRRSEYGTVTKCLEYLFEKKGDPFGYQVFPLEYFIARISQNSKARLNPYISVGPMQFHIPLQNENNLSEEFADFLNSEEFKGYPWIACTHHCLFTDGLLYCPLKIVNEHAYNILSVMADKKYAKAGSHYPSTQDEKREIFIRQQMLQKWEAISLTELPFLKRIREKKKVEPEVGEKNSGTQQELQDYQNNLKGNLEQDLEQILSINEDGEIIRSSFPANQNIKQLAKIIPTILPQPQASQTADVPANSLTFNNPQHQMSLLNFQNPESMTETRECMAHTPQSLAKMSRWQSSSAYPPDLQGSLSYQNLVQNIVQQVVNYLPGPTSSCFHDHSRPICSCDVQNSNCGPQRNCCTQNPFTFIFPNQSPMTFPCRPPQVYSQVTTIGEQRLVETKSQNTNGAPSILNQDFPEHAQNVSKANSGERN